MVQRPGHLIVDQEVGVRFPVEPLRKASLNGKAPGSNPEVSARVESEFKSSAFRQFAERPGGRTGPVNRAARFDPEVRLHREVVQWWHTAFGTRG